MSDDKRSETLERIKDRIAPHFQRLEVGFCRWRSTALAQMSVTPEFHTRTKPEPALVEFPKKYVLGFIPLTQPPRPLVIIVSGNKAIVFDPSVLDVVKKEVAASGLGSDVVLETFERDQIPKNIAA